MATVMLDNGADIRFIQAMLGHADLKSTQIYTHVAVKQLQRIHAATHPASGSGRSETAAMLAELEDEAAEEVETDETGGHAAAEPDA